MFNGGVEWVKGVSVFPFSPFLYFSLRFPRRLAMVGIFSLSLSVSVCLYISSFVTEHNNGESGNDSTPFFYLVS